MKIGGSRNSSKNFLARINMEKFWLYGINLKNWEKIKKTAAEQKVTVLFLKDMLAELIEDLKHDNRNQRDEIIRTLQLVSRL